MFNTTGGQMIEAKRVNPHPFPNHPRFGEPNSTSTFCVLDADAAIVHIEHTLDSRRRQSAIQIRTLIASKHALIDARDRHVHIARMLGSLPFCWHGTTLLNTTKGGAA